jgi:hypothetical protein
MIKMKKTTLLIIFLFCIGFTINAQKQEKKGGRNTRIKGLKIAFLTDKLNLTSKEAEKFWPVYNFYDDKIHQLERIEKRKLLSKIIQAGGIDSISENKAKITVNKVKDIDNQIHNYKNELYNALTKIISYKKILKLKTAEKDFVRNLMRKYRRK